MSRGWRRVAECGDNRAFAAEEISEAIIPALEQDCRAEMPARFLDAVWSIFCDQESSLFKVPIGEQLESLRRSAGPGIGRAIIEHAAMASERGKAGIEGLIESLTNALTDRAAKGARQVEEHYCRKSSSSRAQRVRERIEQGIRGAEIDGLARTILNIRQVPSSRLTVHQGLDDGVRF